MPATELPPTMRIRVEEPGRIYSGSDTESAHVVLTIFTPSSWPDHWAHSGRITVSRQWFNASPLAKLLPGESLDVELAA